MSESSASGDEGLADSSVAMLEPTCPEVAREGPRGPPREIKSGRWDPDPMCRS